MIEQRTGFRGLITNVACTQAPTGALQDAENVVLRRAACIEPRDGVKLLATAAAPPAWGFSFNGKDIYGRYSAGTFAYASTAGDSYTDALTGAPQPMRRDILTAVQARGNLYLPHSAGVAKLESGAGSLKRSGLPVTAPMYLITLLSTGANLWLPSGSSVAYRSVHVSVDANGVERRSLPTGSIIVTGSGGARAVQLQVLWVTSSGSSGVIAGVKDYIEVYRTKTFAAGVTVDDEMQLVATIPASNAGAAVIDDRISESARGKTLYTSPSRGGIANVNNAPPACACVALFKGSLFFGNVRGPRRIQYSFNWAGLVATSTGVGYRQTTANTTAGNPVVVVASATGLQVGMIEAVNSGTIVSIVGTTITMSLNYSSTVAGATLTFYDTIKVGTTSVVAQDAATYLQLTAALLRYVGYNVVPPEGGYNTTQVVETVSRDTTAATIQATHGDEYNPPLPLITATALDLTQDSYPGGIQWTKKDEPEHVRADAYAFVGDAKKAILGLVPTRDALFILKEDGIFRLTGDGASEGVAGPWRIDPYDPTTRCLLPSSVRPLNGRAYFLSNKGVVAFGDGGAEPVSLPIHDLIRDVIEQVQTNFLANGYYELNSVVGSTAAVFERENEYTIMRSATAHPLVYNENTQAWTTWRYYAHTSESLVYSSLFNFDREGRNVYGLASALYGTRLSSDSHLGAITALKAKNDRETAVTASSWNSATSTVTLSGAVTALADDVIQDAAGKLWRVTAAVSSSTTLVLEGPPGATFSTGSCVLYRSLRCRAAPQTYFGNPTRPKNNQMFTAMFSRLHGIVALAYRYSSQLTPLDVDNWLEVDVPQSSEGFNAAGYAPYSRGAAFPQDVLLDHARSWLIDAGVRWVMTHGEARLEGLYMESEEMERRARQQVAA